MTGPNSICGIVPFLLASVAAKEGVDPGRVLRAAGLDPSPPPAVDEHVEATRYFAAWQTVVDRIADPAFALRFAAAQQLEDSEVFGFLAMSCETLFEAYEKTAAYRALYNVGARWELELDERATRLIWYPWPDPGLGSIEGAAFRAAMDFQVADMVNAIQRLGRNQPRPTGVRLMHRAPADLAPFVAQYGLVPVFNAPLYVLEYAPDLGFQPVSTFNSRLRDYFDAECRELMAKLASGSSIVEQVRKKLIPMMDGGDTSIESLAKALGMSARTLQRRLSEEGTRYNQVLDDIRTEFAKRYLARGTVSASEVAYLVGFTEPPAFFKAFKRWTGMTPGAFQQQGV